MSPTLLVITFTGVEVLLALFWMHIYARLLARLRLAGDRGWWVYTLLFLPVPWVIAGHNIIGFWGWWYHAG